MHILNVPHAMKSGVRIVAGNCSRHEHYVACVVAALSMWCTVSNVELDMLLYLTLPLCMLATATSAMMAIYSGRHVQSSPLHHQRLNGTGCIINMTLA
jgi:hypothetical protein